MRNALVALGIAVLASSLSFGQAAPSSKVSSAKPSAPAASTSQPTAIIDTTAGKMTCALFPDKAPLGVANFIGLSNGTKDWKTPTGATKHGVPLYDGTIFHRVIPGFMIQGGGMEPGMAEKDTHEPIKNEAKNGLKNDRGTLAMARTNVVDSATGQFFINLKDNDFLNHQPGPASAYGYAVFGKVTEGMDVIDKIAKVKTGVRRPHADVPLEDVVITSVRRIEAAK
jgi:cyclophilin family peptidyl-prolyl cis-trans isomerase